MPEEEFKNPLSPLQLAARLNVSVYTVWRWCRNNKIKFVKYDGKTIRIPYEEVERLVKEGFGDPKNQ